jgi:PKD repeat protein
MVFRTINTGTNPSGAWLAQITQVATCSDWEGLQPTGSFMVGTELAYFKATVKSNSPTTLTPLLTMSIYDGNMVPIGTIFQTLMIAPNGNASIVVSNEIPSWAYTGNAIVYANLYTDWPYVGGTPYCPEASHAFIITDQAGIASNNSIPTPTSTNGTYGTTFRLSPQPTLGEYSVYVSSHYSGQNATAQTAFQVNSASYPPTASFDYYVAGSGTPDKPYPGGTVTFDASASTPNGGSITSYQWNFGNGQTGSGLTATDSYGQAAAYIVGLTVTDSNGLTCTTSRLVKVWKPYGPKANFTYSPVQPYSGRTTNFNASISQPGWNGIQYPSIISYEWNFGDGNVTTAASPATPHVYKIPGTYTVTLNISDTSGGWNFTSQVLKVDPSPPVASFTYYVAGSATPDKPYPGGNVTFDASASAPISGSITSYVWNFGDTSPKVNKTVPITYHKYTAAGNYTVTLNVTNSVGLWSTMSKTVSVWKTYGPKASFSYMPSQPIANGTTIFNASASTVGWNGTSYPSIISYKWTFGDGNVTTMAVPVIRHVYTHNNTYTVTLTVTDATGKLNATSTTIKIIALAKGQTLKVSVKLVPCTPAHNVYKGWVVNVTVLVIDNGTFPETNFGVTAYLNTTSLGTQTVTSLAQGANTTLIFTWNTAQFAYGNYTIEIQILSPPATAFFRVFVKGIGDIQGNGYVGARDLGLLGAAYNSYSGEPNYNPEADFTASGYVGARDLGILGAAYNTYYPYS